MAGLFFYLLNQQKSLGKNLTHTITVISGLTIVILATKESYGFFKPKYFSYEPAVSETTTWNDEYMPIWVTDKPKDYAPDKIMPLEPHGNISNIKWGYGKVQFTLNDNQPNQIKIAQVFYPGWQAYLSNKPLSISYNNPQGLMTIRTPAGNNQVTFTFAKTWWRWVADITSVLGITIFLHLTIRPLFYSLREIIQRYTSPASSS